MAGHEACPGERLAQQELDLGVRAALLVSGPAGERLVNAGVQPQQDTLPLAHGLLPCWPLWPRRSAAHARLVGWLARLHCHLKYLRASQAKTRL